jgi:phosphinothricin acetyltransferase
VTGVVIRPARIEDARGINDVYNPFIATSPATFETVEYTEDARRAWLTERGGDARHPVFVASHREAGGEDGGGAVICGFASASPFDSRGAYDRSVKTSVFVAPAAVGCGLGKQLYTALFEAIGRTDIHRAYALIVTPNLASVALHQAFDFTHVATLSEVGCKFGGYHDVMWFEKRI